MQKMKRNKYSCRIHLYVVKGTYIVFLLSVIFASALAVKLISYTRGCRADGTKIPAKLAIVIDDFGLQRRGVKDMLELDCKLTIAVMPFLEYSEEDAINAAEHGKEVILHLPMQATTHDNWNHVGPRPFKLGQTEEEITQLLAEMLEDIPQAVGANIHMGTISSTKKEIMLPVLRILKERGMYFLDSKTSTKSICADAAKQVGIRFYENKVFLEHEQKTKSYVKKRLTKAMKIAIDKGSCIAIGHVGAEGGTITVQAIREMKQDFEKNNVELVWLSEISSSTAQE